VGSAIGAIVITAKVGVVIFTLAFHSWTEPIERALQEAKKADVYLIAPKIGETVLLDADLHIPPPSWWNINL